MEIDLDSVSAQLRGADAKQIDQWAQQFVKEHPERDELIGVIGEKEMLDEARAVITKWIADLKDESVSDEIEELLEETEFGPGDIAQLLFSSHIRVIGAPASVSWFNADVLPLIDQALPGFAQLNEKDNALGIEDGLGGYSISAPDCKRLADSVQDVEINDAELYDYVMPYIGAVESAADHGRGLHVQWY